MQPPHSGARAIATLNQTSAAVNRYGSCRQKIKAGKQEPPAVVLFWGKGIGIVPGKKTTHKRISQRWPHPSRKLPHDFSHCPFLVQCCQIVKVFLFKTGPTRLELATSGVTGRRSNQLN